MLPFIKEGIERGDRTIQILDRDQRSECLERLTATSVGAASAAASGQLDIVPWDETYLRGGRFDQNAMSARIEEIANMSAQCRTGITRIWANMEWAIGDFPGVHDVVEYESRINEVLPQYDIAAVCAYDVTKFSASTVMDILRTHPQVIVGGILRENPFYVPPDEFLRELKIQPAA
jgi:DcmR-like sensory protein